MNLNFSLLMPGRLSGLIVAVSFFLLSATSIFAATLNLTPASGVANRGCSFALTIELDTQNADTDGTDALLVYDPTRFSATTTSIVNGSIYPDYPGNVVTPGRVSISGLASVSQPFKGKGTFATINFQVLPTAPVGTTAINFDFDPNDKAKTTDSNVVERGTVVDVLNSVVDGRYTIGTGSCAQQTVGLPQGQALISTPASQPAVPVPTPTPITVLPQGGLNGPTLMLVAAGTVLTVLGIVGLALF